MFNDNLCESVKTGNLKAFDAEITKEITKELTKKQEEKDSDFKAMLDAKNSEGMTLLHIAANQGHFDLVYALLNLNVEIDTLNNNKLSPLDLAITRKNKEIISLLKIRSEWHKELNKMESIPFRLFRILDLIKEAITSIEPGRGKILTAAFGITGSGKSTELSYLMGTDYEPNGEFGYPTYSAKRVGEKAEDASAGHNPIRSETLYPQVLCERRIINGKEEEYCLADTAGIKGTRELEMELAGMMSFYLLSTIGTINNILFVIELGSFSAERAEGTRSAIERLTKILSPYKDKTEEEKIKAYKSIFFVITKSNPSSKYDEKGQIQLILNSTIQPLINDMKEKKSTGAASEGNNDVLFTLERMMENNASHIFIADIFKNTHRERLLKALQEQRNSPKMSLNLLDLDENQRKFIKRLVFLAKEYTSRSKTIEELFGEISSIQTEISEKKQSIRSWENESIIAILTLLQRKQDEINKLLGRINVADPVIYKDYPELKFKHSGETVEEIRTVGCEDRFETFKRLVFGGLLISCSIGGGALWLQNSNSNNNQKINALILGGVTMATLFGLYKIFIDGESCREETIKVAKPGCNIYTFDIEEDDTLKTSFLGFYGKITPITAAEFNEEKDERSFKTRLWDQEKRKFSGLVTLNYVRSEEFLAFVKPKTEKRNLPANKVRIETYPLIANKIKAIQESLIKKYGVSEPRLTSVPSDTDPNQTITKNEALITDALKVLESLYKKLAASKWQLEEILLALKVNQDLFTTITRIVDLSKLDDPDLLKFVEKFNMNLQKESEESLRKPVSQPIDSSAENEMLGISDKIISLLPEITDNIKRNEDSVLSQEMIHFLALNTDDIGQNRDTLYINKIQCDMTVNQSITHFTAIVVAIVIGGVVGALFYLLYRSAAAKSEFISDIMEAEINTSIQKKLLTELNDTLTVLSTVEEAEEFFDCFDEPISEFFLPQENSHDTSTINNITELHTYLVTLPDVQDAASSSIALPVVTKHNNGTAESWNCQFSYYDLICTKPNSSIIRIVTKTTVEPWDTLSEDVFFDCEIVDTNGVCVKHCIGENTEYIEFDREPKTIEPDLLPILGSVAMRGAVFSALPEAVGDTLYYSGLVNETNAQRVKHVTSMLLILITGSWFTTSVGFLATATLKKIGCSDAKARMGGNTAAFFASVGTNITPTVLAATTANYAGGRLGLWAEKRVVQQLVRQEKVPARTNAL